MQIIEYQNQHILTTQQIAEAYETTPKRVSDNFNANKDRYKESIDFYCLEGDELQSFKNNYSGISGVVDSRAPKLYLWTEFGALMHAKSLNTDKAWEVYRHLVETYFRQKQQLALSEEMINALLEQMNQIPWGLSRAETALVEMAMYHILRLTDDTHTLLQKKNLSEKQVQELTTLLHTLHEETAACHETLKKDLAVNWKIDTVCIRWHETLTKALPGPKNK